METSIVFEFAIILLCLPACLPAGARYGGYGLGLISGLRLLAFVFIFHLQPGKPPIDVLLTVMAMLGCASTLQTAGGLNVMMAHPPGAAYGHGIHRLATGHLRLCASPVSVAVVSMVAISAKAKGQDHPVSLLEILSVGIPATFIGMLLAAFWSMRCGLDLDKDPDFQAKLQDPVQRNHSGFHPPPAAWPCITNC